MRKLTLIAICSMLTALCYGQACPDPPAYENTQYFCSAGAWALIGEDADNLGDLQIFAEELGWTITWYSDAALTSPIANPDTELLVGGTTYYVTQTDNLGCESDPLEITVAERDCACIKDPTFEKQNGVPSARGYDFLQYIGISNHKTCGQTMQGASPLAMGTIDGYTGADDAVLVTPGPDPTHINNAGNPTITLPLVRTNPDNPASSHGLRINRGAEYGGPGGNTTITAMQKEFIAGEVFVFNFALVVQNPNHAYDQQPFGQVRLYDQSDNLIQQRCLVSDSNDCIFSNQGNVLYSEWSCMKFYTLEYQGQPLKAEFVTAYCTPTQHYAFMYIDDMYVGDDSDDLCSSAAFGHAVISEVGAAGENCFISEPAATFAGCTPGLSGKIPGFPLQVCGTYSAPISQGGLSLEDFTLRIIQNNSVVGTVSNPQPGDTPNSYCFEVNETDLLVALPYGNFNFEVDIEFELDCGVPYSYLVDSNVNFDLCPTAGCPGTLLICDSTGSGITTFDLTEAEAAIYGDWTTNELELSFYEDIDDAHAGANAITDIENFENTQPGGQTIYVRLVWDMNELDEPCYYLVELELEVAPLPDLSWEDEIVVCEEEFVVTLFARPDNLEDMGQVSYTWFRNDIQIPHAGSYYDVTTPGIYTVIVSNDMCETTQTIEVIHAVFEVELGEDVESCDQGSHTLTAQIIQPPGTEPIDPADLTFEWSTGETSQSITVTDTDLYWVDVTYGECLSTDEVFVAIAQSPNVSLGPDIEACKNDDVVLEAVVDNLDPADLVFTWYEGGVQVGSGQTLDVTDIAGERTYTVEVYEPGADFCYGEASVTVKLYDNENCVITQGLSPGGSLGQNDSLDLQFLSDRTGISVLQIFNRHGLLVYEHRDYRDEWEGQGQGGEELPTGTYFYVIHFSGSDPIYGSQTNGWIYINRDMN